MMNVISIGLIIQLTFLILTVQAQYRNYFPVSASTDWFEAHDACTGQGYDSIASIHTDIDYAKLKDAKDTATPRNTRIGDDIPFWVGLWRPKSGEFTWEDGTPCETNDGLCVSEWAVTPDISGDTVYCATLTVDGTTGDKIYTASSCDSSMRYVCSYINGTAPTPAPYNPLESVDWVSLNLYDQISDIFKDPTNSYESTGFDVMRFEVRTFDGIGNNLNNEGYGSANSITPRCLPPAYEDGIDALAGFGRMNPREISNVLAKQIPEDDDKFVNDRQLTQHAWQWGQFIDHDVTLISEEANALDPSFHIDIYVACGDPIFDSADTCDADEFIEVFRTRPFPGTGTDVTNPRAQRNEITSFVDASMIYGSDQTRAERLRTLVDGELLVTADNFLPPNFVDDPLHNEPSENPVFPVGGDVRQNEQPGLLAFHTIFVRFHNLVAEEVAISLDESYGPEYSAIDRDEQIYQYTKLIVNAVVQKITYKDYLPTLFGATAVSRFLGEFTEYDDTVNPGACPIFQSAAFRLGHTQLPNFLPLRDGTCQSVTFDPNLCPDCDAALGGIELRNAFFIPEITEDNDGFFEALLNGFTCTLSNEIDVSITEGVRNFLLESVFDRDTLEPSHGNLDLMAINIQRGREHGLPDYNTVREGMGLNRFTDFSQMTSDSELADNFEAMYGDIDDVDLFLGLLAEDHLSDGSFGETMSAVVLGQFKRFRDGDRFWYERYIQPGALLDFIESVTLKSVIELTTDIASLGASDAFQNDAAVSIFANQGLGAAKAAPQSLMGRIMDQEIQNQPKSNIDNQPKSDISKKHKHNNNIHQHQHHPQQQPPVIRPNYGEDNEWFGNDNNDNNDNNDYYQPPPIDTNPGVSVMQLILIASIILNVGFACYAMHQCKKNQINRYRPVKYDTEFESDSDREKLKA